MTTNNNKKISLSVIIATYNRAGYLEAALQSVLQQTRAPDEIVVVDDGSDDATAALLAAYGERIVVRRQANRGKASALNNALQHVDSSHVCFFDDDDYMLTHGLQLHVETLERYPAADYSYSPNLIYEDADPTSITDSAHWRASRHPQCAAPDRLFIKTLEWGDAFLTYLQGMLIPLACLRGVGPFDETLLRAQDYDMMLRLSLWFRGQSTGQPTFVMRNHSGVRGPSFEPHRRADRERHWQEYNRRIVLGYRRTLDLAAYLPKDAGVEKARGLSVEQRFAALLQRSRTMFSHGFFDEGFEDIRLLCTSLDLDPSHRAALTQTLACAAKVEKAAALEHLSDFALAALDCARRSGERRLVIAGIARGFYWGWVQSCRRGCYGQACRFARATTMLLMRAAWPLPVAVGQGRG